MKKVLLSLIVLMVVSISAFAQGASRDPRSVNAVRMQCNSSFFQGSNWDISAVKELDTRCAYSEVITGPGEVWIVVASYRCTSEICPAIADQILGRVYWCGNDVDYVECY